MAQEWENNGPMPPNGPFGYNFENGEQPLNGFAMDDAVFDEFLLDGFDNGLEVLPNALGARGALEAIVGESLPAEPVEPKGQDEVIVIPDDDNEEGPFLGEKGFAVSAYGTHFLPDQLLRDEVRHPVHVEQICLNKVLEIFPDICREYAKDLLKAHNVNQDSSQKVIDTILDRGKYPKERDTKKDLKRKREERENTMSYLATAKNAKLDEEDDAMCECKCCYSEYKFSEVTHCGGEEIHFFCLDCARRYAENEMGLSRWRLTCIDPSGCKAPFERSEMNRFLSRKSTQILDRLQQQEELSAAGLEGLTNCPFCDFSAICESVEIDKEFRCMNPECERISCRLCMKETHVPLTCSQHEKDSKLNVRHAVEEAMSEALFRKCSKCGKKYIKEHGCNKMTCPSCRTVQCYICSAVLDPVAGYNHFNDTTRGGKKDGCALFDDSEKRHNENVAAAEKAAIAKIKTDNPELSEEELRVKLSKRVADDEAKRLKESAKTNARMGRARPRGVNEEVERHRVLREYEERHRAAAAPAYPHPVQWVYEQPAPPLPVMEGTKNQDGQFAFDHRMDMAHANLDYMFGLHLDQEVPAIPVAMPVGLDAMHQAAELEGQVPLHIRQQGQQQTGALIDPLGRMDAQQQVDFQNRFERLAALRAEHEAKQLLERERIVQRARGQAVQHPGGIKDNKKNESNDPRLREARLQAMKDRYKPPNDHAQADNGAVVQALLPPPQDIQQRQVERRAADHTSRFRPARMLANLQELVHHSGQRQGKDPVPQQDSRAQTIVNQQLVVPAERAGHNVYNEPMLQPDGRLPHPPAALNPTPDARARYIAHPSSSPVAVPALDTASATSVHAGAGIVLGPGVAIGPGVNFGENPRLQRHAAQQQRERLYEHMGMLRPPMNEHVHAPGRWGDGPAGP